MRTVFLFGFIFSSVALVCCDKPVEETQYTFPVIELHHCGDTAINGNIVQICFDSVLSDSRCPMNASCIWEGEASVKLSLHTGTVHQSFKLSTFNNPPTFRNDTTISGYKIKLLSVSPYPGDQSHTPYRVELSLTR